MPETLLKESLSLLSQADASRKAANSELKLETKSAFGQYMTPATVASFMAALFPGPVDKVLRLLDPGAGVGSLTSAFVEHFCRNGAGYQIDVDAYEIDPIMRSYLGRNFDLCETAAMDRGSKVTWRIIAKDFIIDASRKVASLNSLWPEKLEPYTHCIMNPPYKKIPGASRHRACLRTAGIETVNLYSAFVALSLLMLKKSGYMVAIIPRSFCNGPYYRPFREFLFKQAALRRIHLFGSRNKAFKEDKVLQENIIVVLEKGGRKDLVTVSTSTDDSFTDITLSDIPFNQVVKDDDQELFIHIPASPEADFLNDAKEFSYSLSQIGVQVSTGPVVDFRMKDQLKEMPQKDTVPLLYPCHFRGQAIQWPIEGGKKPNAILHNPDTEKWLYPNGFYTVVRRFSSKEERRRIVARVVDPGAFPEFKKLGLENHLNVFHSNREPLTEALARGLAVFLNSTAVDTNFRRFSGHTQVNATDLKLMNYPSRKALVKLGKWASKQEILTQDMIDKEIESISE